VADGLFGQMVGIRDGKYAYVDLQETGVAARRVNVDEMYNLERFRPRYDRKLGEPMLLVGLD
jgi:6-phosphofructokinase 1